MQTNSILQIAFKRNMYLYFMMFTHSFCRNANLCNFKYTTGIWIVLSLTIKMKICIIFFSSKSMHFFIGLAKLRFFSNHFLSFEKIVKYIITYNEPSYNMLLIGIIGATCCKMKIGIYANQISIISSVVDVKLQAFI